MLVTSGHEQRIQLVWFAFFNLKSHTILQKIKENKVFVKI